MSVPACCYNFSEWGAKLLAPLTMVRASMEDILAQTNGCGREGVEGCSTRSLTIHPDGTVNASQTALGYCPEAVLIRVEDGRVEMLSEASGVGATVQALGRDAVEAMR